MISESDSATLGSLSRDVQSKLGYKTDRVLKRLMELEEAKKIKIEEKAPFKSLGKYASSPIALWFWVAVFATMLSLGLIFVSSGVGLYLRYLFGGSLVLFLPGFALVEFFYAKRKELDDLTRVAFSIGLSLAIVALIGLSLNYTPFGIRLVPVAVSLASFTVIFLALALRRKHAYYKVAHDLV